MPRVKVKGVANPMDFPDDMDIEDIKAFLQKRFANMATTGQSTVDVNPIQATAQASNPTLQERFSQGVGSALTSSGLVSNNYQAQNIGKNIGNIAALTPAGAAFGGDEFGAAAKNNDKLGMALGALEGAGIGGDIAKLAIFGGVLAKTADLGALAKAKKLETSGADRDEIWKETGWANDKGDWKFEINDGDYELNEKASNVYDALKGSDAPKSYPDSKEISFSSVNMPFEYGGVYSKADGVEINLNRSDEERKTTALHESQHMIQELEGFEIGGNASPMFVDGMQKEIKSKLSAVGNDILAITKGSKYQERLKDLLSTKGVRRRAATKQVNEEFGVTGMAELELVLNEATSNPVKAYRLLAGESEARNVETRINFTKKQRRDNPPWSSLDIPESTIIYKNNPDNRKDTSK